MMNRRNAAKILALAPAMALPVAAEAKPGRVLAEERKLLVKSACQDLSVRYTHCIADGDFDGLANVFAPDGVLEVAGKRSAGAAAIVAFFKNDSGLADRNQRARLMITNELIDVTDERHATGKAFFAIFRLDLSKGPMLKSVAPAALATSEDAYVRTALGWRLSHRRIELLAAATG